MNATDMWFGVISKVLSRKKTSSLMLKNTQRIILLKLYLCSEQMSFNDS